MKKKWLNAGGYYNPLLKWLRIMKLTLFVLLITLVHVSASVYSQQTRLSISANNISVKEVLRDIEDQSEFFFLYKNEDINVDRIVSVNMKDKSLEELLGILFKGTDVSYKIHGRQIVLVNNVPQEQKKITVAGKVTDSSSVPLPGVTVLVKGTSQGIVTNFDGKYSLPNVPSDGTLIFSFVGMRAKEIEVSGRTTIDVKLEEETFGIDEVVAVGYGTVVKRDLTGAVSRVDNKELENRPVLRVDQMLQGQAAGVDVKSVSGEPGAGTTIRIRGARSINATNEPLYVIDGLIGVDDLNSINPEDIESVDILKDASATAIYGSRGANGVIIITTKRGRSGENKISVNVTTGVEMLPADRKPELMNPSEFVQFIKDARENKKTTAQLVNDQQYQYVSNLDLQQLGEGTDWIDAVSRTGSFNNVNINASGGNEKLQYYLSGNFARQEGIIIGSGYKRYQFRLNLDRQIGKILKIGTSINFSNTNTDLTQVDFGKSTSWTRSILALSPTFPVFKEDGSYYSFNNFAYSGGGYFDSPVAYGELWEKNRIANTLLSNFYADFRLSEGLSFRSTFGAQFRHQRENYFVPTNTPRKIATNTMLAYASVNMNTVNYLLSENTLNYNKDFGDHKLNVMAGITWQNEVAEWLYSRGDGFTNNIYRWNNLAAVDQSGKDVGSSYSENTMISFLGRINYNYANKYYLTLTSRYDGASNFAKDHKWGFFPSAAAKWRLSEEEFVKDLGYFDNLSLKVSYGKSGNQGISNYVSLGTLSSATNGYIFGDTPALAYYSGRLPNNDLSWETSTQIDIGFEMGVFKNRLSIEANYYNTNTSDLLLNVQIPRQTGYNSRLMNLGETSSNGFEFMINSRNIERGKFSWNTRLTMTTNHQEIVDLGPLVKVSVDNNSYGGTTTYYEVGVPLGALYGAYYAGTWKSQKEINAELSKPAGEREFVSQSNMYQPGRMKYKDLNHDGLLGDDDKPYLGSPNPKLFGRIENTFRYGNWDLDVALNGNFGAKMYNDVMFFMGTGGSDGVYTNQFKSYKNYWHPTRNPYSDIPVPNSRDNVPSTYILQNASFVRLSSVKLGYQIDTRKLGMGYIRSAYVYFSGNNLWLFTDYNNFDPEVNKNGTSSTVRGKDDGVYPNSRAFTFGVKIDF